MSTALTICNAEGVPYLYNRDLVNKRKNVSGGVDRLNKHQQYQNAEVLYLAKTVRV